MALIRPDQSPVPETSLFARLRGAARNAGVVLPGHPDQVAFTASLGPSSVQLGQVTVTAAVTDSYGDVYQLAPAALPADGVAHTLAMAIDAGGGQPAYPLRLTSVTVFYTMPATPAPAVATFRLLGVSGGTGGTGPPALPGTALRGWSPVASSPELTGVQAVSGAAGRTAAPAVVPASQAPAGQAQAVTFRPGFGQAVNPGAPNLPIGGQLVLTDTAPTPPVIPGAATQSFLDANNTSVGQTVQAIIDGTDVDVKIVSAVATFPTVTQPAGAVIIDLPTLQAFLNSRSLPPAVVTQWWLGTGGRQPASLAAVLPPGSAITTSAAIASALLTNPLSTVPQQALLAIALAAAVLAITGFCVSIAAGVRQRRAENALLAALGVPARSAASQLCLEKLMLSLPAAVAGPSSA